MAAEDLTDGFGARESFGELGAGFEQYGDCGGVICPPGVPAVFGAIDGPV